MQRKNPSIIYTNEPCSVVTIGTSLNNEDEMRIKELYSPRLKHDGYLSLNEMNILIRKHLRVKKCTKYPRAERKPLKEVFKDFKGRAVVCVLGHYLYVEDDTYYSFFNNDNDMVVAVWELR